jgi:hypothetical protein
LLTYIRGKQDAVFINQHQSFEGLEKDLKDLIQQEAQGKSDMKDVMRRHSEAIAKIPVGIIARFAIGFDETREHVTRIVLSSEERQRIRDQKDQLLRSFRFNPRNARKTAVRRAHDETFQWLLNAPDEDIRSTFRKWILGDDEPIFWVQGKPGSGKSTLMKFLASNKETFELLQSKHLTNAIYCHFIWMADNRVDGTLRGLLCSLIHQILEADTNEHLIARLHQNHPDYRYRTSPLDWEMDELELVLKILIKFHEGFILMFIDGLDELDVSEDRSQLKQSLLQVALDASSLKLCVSSRPEPEMKLLLGCYPTIRLQDLTNNDLRTVAKSEVGKYFAFALREISAFDLEVLVSRIVEKAQGVFLWITLALIRIRRGSIAFDSLDQLKQSLEDTPLGLNDLYRSMWDRLGPDKKRYQKSAGFLLACLQEWKNLSRSDMLTFHLVVCLEQSMIQKMLSGRGMFLQGKDFSKACSTTQRQAESYCAGLVEFRKVPNSQSRYLDDPFHGDGIDNTGGLVIDFVHRSLNNFLYAEGRWMFEDIDMESVHVALFNAAIGEAIVGTGLRPAKFVISDTYRRSVGSPPPFWSIGIKLWSLESHPKLGLVMTQYQRWGEYTERHRGKSGLITPLRENGSRQNLLLIKDVFGIHSMTNFLEEVDGHLGCVELVASLAVPNLAAYLGWRGLDRGAVHDFSSTYRNSHRLERLIRHDTGWAYPHTLFAVFHVIPQLLTVAASTLTYYEPCWSAETLITRLLQLRHEPHRRIIQSTILEKDWGSSFPATCGILLPDFLEYNAAARAPASFIEIIYRIDFATVVNRVVSRVLSRSCSAREYPWTPDQELELKDLRYPEDHCEVEILLVGHVHNGSGAQSVMLEPVATFDPARFRHLSDRFDHIHPNFADLFDQILVGRHAKYFVPSKAQAVAIAINLDPDYLPETFAGPYDQICCIRDRCRYDEEKVETDKLARLIQYHGPKTDEMRRIASKIMLGDNERVYDIPEFLRGKGHYIPTEDDWLEFMEAKSTYERVAVLNRLNHERAEKEAWMLNP